MDDIWLFGRDPARLRRAQLDIQEAMSDLGLNMALAKTAVLEGDDVPTGIQRRDHSAVDVGLQQDEPDTDAMEELIDRLLEKPETASRTSIRFVTERMRRFRIMDRVDDFADKAERMPHASDALARLFRDSNKWRELDEWYVEYIDSNWGAIDWSVAQFGTMFPSKEAPSEAVKERLTKAMLETRSVTLTALGAQRLGAWDADEARVAIREAAKRADNPLVRRALALGALGAGEERAFVKKLLSEFEENQATTRMLQDSRFKKPKARPDFEGP
jgi:hypothetical protein